MFAWVEELLELLRPISRFFYALFHPIETITKWINLALLYLPALCIIIFLFYIITGSTKILSVMLLVILMFTLFKFAVVFDLVWVSVLVVIALLLIIFIGRVM